jgi:predicted nuclease of predicted toxin-antitoxin system
MKILLDECVPWPMHKLLVGHTYTTAQKRGWHALKNGELIQKAETGFDLFITCDLNIGYQQNLQGRRIAILELSTNDLRRIMASGELLHQAVATIQPGEYRELSIP